MVDIAATPTGVMVAPLTEQIAHYCIVRSDLSCGRQMAMIGHAAGESSPGIEAFPKHTFFLALAAKDEKHLQELSWMLSKEGIPHRSVYESDAPYTGQLMAIGIPPQPRERIRKLLSNLPRAGKEFESE